MANFSEPSNADSLQNNGVEFEENEEYNQDPSDLSDFAPNESTSHTNESNLPNNNQTSNQPNSSLIDDYADVSQEPLDILDPD